jgi:hypothetical protein
MGQLPSPAAFRSNQRGCPRLRGVPPLHIDTDERTNVTSAWHISFACLIP